MHPRDAVPASELGRPRPGRLVGLGIGGVLIAVPGIVVGGWSISEGSWPGALVFGGSGLVFLAMGIIVIVKGFRPSISVDGRGISVDRWPLGPAAYRWDEVATMILVGPRQRASALWIIPRTRGPIAGLSWFSWPTDGRVIDRLFELGRERGADVVAAGVPSPPPVALEPPESRIVVRAHIEPWMWVLAVLWSVPGVAVIISGGRQGDLALGLLVGTLCFLVLPGLLVVRAVAPVLVIDRTGVRGGVVDRTTLTWNGPIVARMTGRGTMQPMVIIEGRGSDAGRIRAPLRLMRMRLSDLPSSDTTSGSALGGP